MYNKVLLIHIKTRFCSYSQWNLWKVSILPDVPGFPCWPRRMALKQFLMVANPRALHRFLGLEQQSLFLSFVKYKYRVCSYSRQWAVIYNLHKFWRFYRHNWVNKNISIYYMCVYIHKYIYIHTYTHIYTLI